MIRELGSPQKVAATIKADLKCGSTDAGLFTECGYEDERFTAKATPAKRSDGDEKQESTQESESGIPIQSRNRRQKETDKEEERLILTGIRIRRSRRSLQQVSDLRFC